MPDGTCQIVHNITDLQFTPDWYIQKFFVCDLNFSCENDQKVLYKIIKADYTLGLKSEYHTRQVSRNILKCNLMKVRSYNSYLRGQSLAFKGNGGLISALLTLLSTRGVPFCLCDRGSTNLNTKFFTQN